jgi:hypothetical protein
LTGLLCRLGQFLKKTKRRRFSKKNKTKANGLQPGDRVTLGFSFPYFFSTRLGFSPESAMSQATRQAKPGFKTIVEGAHEL